MKAHTTALLLLLVGGCEVAEPEWTWSQFEGRFARRIYPAMAVQDERLWSVGGFDEDDNPSDRFQVYDPVEGTVLTLAPLPDELGGGTLWAVEGGFLHLGGCWRAEPSLRNGSMWAPVPTIFRYVMAEDRWEELAEGLPHGVCGAAALEVDGRLLLTGGWQGGETPQGWWVEPSGAVESGPALDGERQGAGVTLIGGRPTLVGGWAVGVPVLGDTLSWSGDAWEQGIAPPLPMAFGVATRVDGALWWIGGKQQEEIGGDPREYTFSERVWVLDEVEGTWSAGPPMPDACWGMGGGWIGDRFYVAAGACDGGYPASGSIYVLAREEE